MPRTIGQLIHDLDSLDPDEDDFMDRLYEISDELEASSDRSSAVRPVFEFLESHADADLGAPGPLVHFLETFSGREFSDALLGSLRRRATVRTVWMLNRLINSVQGPERQTYIDVLRSLGSASGLDRDVRERAAEYLTYQSQKERGAR